MNGTKLICRYNTLIYFITWLLKVNLIGLIRMISDEMIITTKCIYTNTFQICLSIKNII